MTGLIISSRPGDQYGWLWFGEGAYGWGDPYDVSRWRPITPYIDPNLDYQNNNPPPAPASPAPSPAPAANNGTFTKKYLPPGAQNCSATLTFHAPSGFDLNAIVAAGKAGGLNPFAGNAAVGHYGTFDFQRSKSGKSTTFYSGYTDASNVAVGAYLYGAGFSNSVASFISNSFAYTMSSNAGSPQQADFRNLGYDLAAAGWNPSCH